MTIKNKFLSLSDDELLGLLDKYNSEIENVLQEIFKRQDEGRMEKFINAHEWLEKNSTEKFKKAS